MYCTYPQRCGILSEQTCTLKASQRKLFSRACCIFHRSPQHFGPNACNSFVNMPVSEPRRRKEELLKVLRELGAQYGVAVNLTRDSDNAAYRTAYRKLSHKVHPDKGGTVADQQRLNAAHGEWQRSARASAGARPSCEQRNRSRLTRSSTSSSGTTRQDRQT